MIFLKLVPNVGSQAAVNAILDDLRKRCEDLPDLLVETSMVCTEDLMRETFAGEGVSPTSGSGVWNPLAKRTVREREALGFPGEHPILFRTGEMWRSLTLRGYTSHIVEKQALGPGRMIGHMGTTDPKFELHQIGHGVENPELPKRPIWPEDDNERQFMVYLEKVLVHLVEGKPIGP